MTTKADYEAEEWEAISLLPTRVSFAVMISGTPGPIQVVHETGVFAAHVIEQPKDGNELVEAVVTLYRTDKETPKAAAPQKETMASYRDEALAACRKVNDILAAKSTPEEADGYKQWVVGLGRKVAEASKEGGFLGIGGTRVSAEEQATLSETAAALGVSEKAPTVSEETPPA